MSDKTRDREVKIINSVIKCLLDNEFKISLNDGEETILIDSTDPREIKKHMFSTDLDYFYVSRIENGQKRQGIILFVYGNDGSDVIADHSTHLEVFLKDAFDLSDSME